MLASNSLATSCWTKDQLPAHLPAKNNHVCMVVLVVTLTKGGVHVGVSWPPPKAAPHSPPDSLLQAILVFAWFHADDVAEMYGWLVSCVLTVAIRTARTPSPNIRGHEHGIATNIRRSMFNFPNSPWSLLRSARHLRLDKAMGAASGLATGLWNSSVQRNCYPRQVNAQLWWRSTVPQWILCPGSQQYSGKLWFFQVFTS